jgi:hypothetical protein
MTTIAVAKKNGVAASGIVDSVEAAAKFDDATGLPAISRAVN